MLCQLGIVPAVVVRQRGLKSCESSVEISELPSSSCTCIGVGEIEADTAVASTDAELRDAKSFDVRPTVEGGPTCCPNRQPIRTDLEERTVRHELQQCNETADSEEQDASESKPSVARGGTADHRAANRHEHDARQKHQTPLLLARSINFYCGAWVHGCVPPKNQAQRSQSIGTARGGQGECYD